MLTDIQFEQAVAAFVTFFVLIDAPGVAPIFASLTAPGGSAYARKTAVKATFVAALILFFFAFAGAWLLEHLGISLDAFRVAGGVLDRAWGRVPRYAPDTIATQGPFAPRSDRPSS